MLIYGHRGASAEAPENTVRAFARALTLGVDGIELDLRATLDRVPVVIHDRDLHRTTNSHGAIDRLTLAELHAVSTSGGDRVPTLDEVLTLTGDRVHFDLEIKQGGIEEEVLDVLAHHRGARWAISSFDWTSLERVRARSIDADIWLLASKLSNALFRTASRLRASTIALHDLAYTAESAEKLRMAGFAAVIWTVNDPHRATELRDLGATAICTDDPAALRSLRQDS